MGLFGTLFGKKSYPPKASVDAGEDWLLGAGVTEEGPEVVRIRRSAKKLAGHPEYPHLFVVGVDILKPDANGFHSPEEGKEIGKIEDKIVDSFEEDKEGIFVLSSVRAGLKTFSFYTGNPQQLAERFEKALGDRGGREIGTHTEADPEWRVYLDRLP